MNEEVREEWEHIAAEGGIPYMLDCMGMDGLGNEVCDLYKQIKKLEWMLGQTLDALDEQGGHKRSLTLASLEDRWEECKQNIVHAKLEDVWEEDK